MNQYSINKSEVKETFGQIKKHISQLSQSDIKAIKSKLNKININNIKLSQHANQHIKLDYKDIKRCFSAYDIIEFNITYRFENPTYRVLIRSKESIPTVVDNKLIKTQVCIVYDLTKNIVVSLYLNDSKDNHETLNLDRYNTNMTIDIGKLLC